MTHQTDEPASPAPPPAPSAPAVDVPTEGLNGKTPWEFACQWYTPGQIAYSIARDKAGFGSFLIENFPHPGSKIPADIYSEQFSEWLTHQYRLAMRKGIEIGQRAASTDHDELKRELERLREYKKMLHGLVTEWQKQCLAADEKVAEQAATITRLTAELEQEREKMAQLQKSIAGYVSR